MSLSMLGMVAAILYCFARGIVDLRQRRFGWAAAGIASGVALLLVPIPSHAIKIELPHAATR